MSKPDEQPSADHEPTFIDQPAQADPSEQKADQTLGSERKRRRPDAMDAALHSVFEEPDIFPGRKPEVINRDWSCSQCGYNLRGLSTGHRCPECGHVELYRPPPVGGLSYGEWYQKKKAAVSDARSWGMVVLAAVCSGPWAVVGTLLNNLPSPLTVMVFGPATEEVMKLALLAILIESRPYLFKGPRQIRYAALGSALGFAIIENILYLKWVIVSPSITLILWRWIVCSGLHLGCTAIGVSGLIRIWEKADHENRVPRLGGMIRPLVYAIVAHGIYNGYAMFSDMLGYAF